jgi:hypothetical protein
MTPSDKSYGLIAAMQAPLWKYIKQAVPSFIHASTKKSLLAWMKNAKQNFKSISLDGTAFDSS